MVDVAIGDKYPWKANASVRNGGRPTNGDVDGEGYTECPKCGKDFWLLAIVRNDILEDIKIDSSKAGYVE